MHSALRKAAFLAALLLAAAPLAQLPAAAQSTVKATVDGQPITSYDVSQRVRLLELFHQKTSPKLALDDLVDETVVAQAAAKRNLTVPDAQVQERFNGLAKQVKLTPDAFSSALKKAGVEPDTLRKLLRAQIMFGLVMRAKARSLQADVTEADIQAELAKEGLNPSSATMREYRLQQIVFVIPRGSSPGLVPQRQRDAESFRKRFNGCDGSLALAQSMKGVVVVDAGRRDTSQIDGDFAEALAKTSAGSTMKPEVTGRGVEVIAVCDVKEIQSTAGIRAEVEKKLSAEQTKDLDKTVKAELRKDANIVYN
ncbi:hypothetical protein C3941_07865 [Kaistia algarum]|uniref:SurA N-terminal domain-containing protein n=1 Tax=Kaistia algarum TaxID=2083279 RepID=UPI000CE83A11|nr:SurA N-terminal domain-containing protein [Kaistia algarum]MCX5511972.1 SurA N-terminal domain-containing protein [Kaistia algarum]PPE80103.1 hypothetical protein C3941_07865 [Kaistia algarum]